MLRVGMIAESSATRMPTLTEMAMNPGCGVIGKPAPLLAVPKVNPAIRANPTATPSAVPTDSHDHRLPHEDRPVSASAIPSALRMPICLVFCTAEIASVEAMPSATATSTNTWIM